MPNVPSVPPQFESDVDGLMYEVDSPDHRFKADEGISLRAWPKAYISVPKLGLRMNVADFDWSKDQVSKPDRGGKYHIKYHIHLPVDPLSPPVFRVATITPDVPNMPVPRPPVRPVPDGRQPYYPEPQLQPFAPWMPQTPAYEDDIPYDVYVNPDTYFNPYAPTYDPYMQYVVQHQHHFADPYGNFVPPPVVHTGPTGRCGELQYVTDAVVERATGKPWPMQCSQFANVDMNACVHDLTDRSPYSLFKPLSATEAEKACVAARDYCSLCKP